VGRFVLVTPKSRRQRYFRQYLRNGRVTSLMPLTPLITGLSGHPSAAAGAARQRPI
jgi:hypothetical protein